MERRSVKKVRKTILKQCDKVALLSKNTILLTEQERWEVKKAKLRAKHMHCSEEIAIQGDDVVRAHVRKAREIRNIERRARKTAERGGIDYEQALALHRHARDGHKKCQEVIQRIRVAARDAGAKREQENT